uniref:Uncharacterized protein n=1 Tax=Anguilla anguilla TaxID=7936 RepID=A0A0E9X113_ANGAN
MGSKQTSDIAYHGTVPAIDWIDALRPWYWLSVFKTGTIWQTVQQLSYLTKTILENMFLKTSVVRNRQCSSLNLDSYMICNT